MDSDELSQDPSDDSPSSQSTSQQEEECKSSQSDSNQETQNIIERYSSESLRVKNSYQVPCVNRCGKVIDCDMLDDHIANECPLTVVDCTFKHIGCDLRLPRRDMPIHLGQAVVYHLSKQTTAYEERLKVLEADSERMALKCKRLEAKHEELEQHVSRLSHAFKEDLYRHEMVCYENVDLMSRHNQSQDDTVCYSNLFTTEPESASLTPVAFESGSTLPANLILANFEQHRQNDDYWISQPFYTHTQGYKMCLRVTANGQGSGKGTHITVAVYLMKGEFDDQLEWPFRGNITIQLLSQQGDGEHYTRTIYQAQGERGKTNGAEKFISAWGIGKFKAHSELYPKYLKYDTLKFCIITQVNKQSTSLVETEV